MQVHARQRKINYHTAFTLLFLYLPFMQRVVAVFYHRRNQGNFFFTPAASLRTSAFSLSPVSQTQMIIRLT